MGQAQGPRLAPQHLQGLSKPLGSGNAGVTLHTHLRESQWGRAQCENTNGQHAVGPTNTCPFSFSRAQQGRMPGPTGAGCYQIWGFPQRARSAHCSLSFLGFNKVNFERNKETKKIARSPSALAELRRPRLLLPTGPKQSRDEGVLQGQAGVGGRRPAQGRCRAPRDGAPPAPTRTSSAPLFSRTRVPRSRRSGPPWATQPHRRTGNSRATVSTLIWTLGASAPSVSLG